MNPYAQVQNRGVLGAPRGAPRGAPPAEDDGGGWQEVSSSRRPERPAYDPNHRFNQSYKQIEGEVDRAASHSREHYSTVQVRNDDLKELHRKLRKEVHNEVIHTYPNGNTERLYVTAQSFDRKAGGFNITTHEYNRNGVDVSRRDDVRPRVNIHVLPPNAA